MNLNNDVPYILGKWFAIQCQTAYHASDFKFGTNPIYQLSANFERKPIDTFAKIESKVYPHRSKLSRDKEGLYIKYSKLSLELMSKVESIPTSALGANFYLGYNHQLAEFMTKKES